MKKISLKNGLFGSEKLVAVFGIIVLILLGHYRLLAGANFFIHDDWLSISNYTYGNTLGNGWRPDKSLGISFFFGEPGMWNPWSLLSLWERIVPSREFAYTFSVLILMVCTAFILYVFLKEMNLNGLNNNQMILLSVLVIFCCYQETYYFSRGWITLVLGIPLMVMFLFDYLQKPRPIHYFVLPLIYCLVALLGNLWSLTQICSLGFFTAILFALYYKRKIMEVLGRYLFISFLAGAVFLILSSWAVYPLLLEKVTVEYARVKVKEFPAFDLRLNLAAMINYLHGLLMVQWVPLDHNIVGIGYKPLHSFVPHVVFPPIFVYFLSQKAQSFWEFAYKWLIIILLIHTGLEQVVPYYGSLYAYFHAKTTTVVTMYSHIYPLQIALLAIFVSRIGQSDLIVSNKGGRLIQQGITVLLVCFFSALSIFSLVAISAPEALPRLAGRLFENSTVMSVLGQRLEFVREVMLYNLQRVQELMHWHTALFCATSILIVAPFLNNKWLMALGKIPKYFIVLMLLANAMLYSWSVYPLNEQPLFWQSRERQQYAFEATDRFYRVEEGHQNDLEYFRRVWSGLEGGGHRVRELVGFVEPPGLNLSGLVSFDSKANAELLYYIFKDAGSPISSLRELYRGGPVVAHELLDMAAVKYYYSDREILNPPQNLTLIIKERQLYVYENKNAWPYFYLANDIKVKEGEHLKSVTRGSAYVDRADMFELGPKAGSSIVGLKKFSYGDLLFDFNGRQEEFMVIADAWHPFWQAEANGQPLQVLKANEVFKGVRLPAGQYAFRLFFDTTPYKKGIPVSIVSWILFIAGFIYVSKRRQNPAFKEANQ